METHFTTRWLLFLIARGNRRSIQARLGDHAVDVAPNAAACTVRKRGGYRQQRVERRDGGRGGRAALGGSTAAARRRDEFARKPHREPAVDVGGAGEASRRAISGVQGVSRCVPGAPREAGRVRVLGAAAVLVRGVVDCDGAAAARGQRRGDCASAGERECAVRGADAPGQRGGRGAGAALVHAVCGPLV